MCKTCNSSEAFSIKMKYVFTDSKMEKERGERKPYIEREKERDEETEREKQ